MGTPYLLQEWPSGRFLSAGTNASGQSGRGPRIQKKAAEMPETMRKAYLRAAAGTASPRAAIKAFCLECVGYVRAEVTQCTDEACPLFMYRPFQP